MSSKFRKNYTMLLFVCFSEGGPCLVEPQASGGGEGIHKSGGGRTQIGGDLGCVSSLGFYPGNGEVGAQAGRTVLKGEEALEQVKNKGKGMNNMDRRKSKDEVNSDCHRDFPGGPVVKNPPSNAGDVASIPGQGN